ncbi:MAG TPA: hypothetical protein VGK73_39820 [Polyangiaceae bacterium]
MLGRRALGCGLPLGVLMFVALPGCAVEEEPDSPDPGESGSGMVEAGRGGSGGRGGSAGESAGGMTGKGTSGSTGKGGTAGQGGSDGGSSTGAAGTGSGGDAGDGPSAGGGSAGLENPLTGPEDGPPAGNPDGACPIPAEAGLADSSSPDHVVGDGTPESCTSERVVAAVALGGVITFDCGESPITITLDETARIYNDASDRVVIDGGGLVTLSGAGARRILYMNTCDPDLHYTTDHCQDQPYPELTVQNLTFIDANSESETEYDGGGAIWVRGGRFKLVNTRFFNNVCAPEGPDVGGAAVRVFSQYQGQPVYVVNSTFGGAEGFGNTGSNGGGISSIGVSWTIINSLFSYNHAIGEGGNPAEPGTPGGGSGGAIYNDGDTMTLSLCGTLVEHNDARAYGSAVFFVSNDHSGTLRIEDSVIRANSGGGWNVLPGISMHEDTNREIVDSTIE